MPISIDIDTIHLWVLPQKQQLTVCMRQTSKMNFVLNDIQNAFIYDNINHMSLKHLRFLKIDLLFH